MGQEVKFLFIPLETSLLMIRNKQDLTWKECAIINAGSLLFLVTEINDSLAAL